jgi:hypothetical protein
LAQKKGELYDFLVQLAFWVSDQRLFIIDEAIYVAVRPGTNPYRSSTSPLIQSSIKSSGVKINWLHIIELSEAYTEASVGYGSPSVGNLTSEEGLVVAGISYQPGRQTSGPDQKQNKRLIRKQQKALFNTPIRSNHKNSKSDPTQYPTDKCHYERHCHRLYLLFPVHFLKIYKIFILENKFYIAMFW